VFQFAYKRFVPHAFDKVAGGDYRDREIDTVLDAGDESGDEAAEAEAADAERPAEVSACPCDE